MLCANATNALRSFTSLCRRPYCRVSVYEFVANQKDWPIRNELLAELLRKTVTRLLDRLRRAREDAIIVGDMIDFQWSNDPQYIENGIISRSKQSREQRERGAVIGRAGETKTLGLSQSFAVQGMSVAAVKTGTAARKCGDGEIGAALLRNCFHSFTKLGL